MQRPSDVRDFRQEKVTNSSSIAGNVHSTGQYILGASKPRRTEKLVPYFYSSLLHVLGPGFHASLLHALPHLQAQQHCKNLSTNQGINQEIEAFDSTNKFQIQCPVVHLCYRGILTAQCLDTPGGYYKGLKLFYGNLPHSYF